ncbi:MAG TPA: 50S ribosomal protein L11 methyltransferase [Acidimicrobiales bacterium]|nr:50S ribosomal protein L11 methyltransferase [Acidimicrobiales bacterium]
MTAPVALPRDVSRAVRVTVPAAEAELAADALWQAGAVAIEERAAPGGTVVLVAGGPAGGGGAGPGRDGTERLLAAAAGRWPAEVEEVDLGAALDAWRAFARPVRVGRRLVVRPPWVPASAGGGDVGRSEVTIDPGRAFGSGAHPSTRLALAALDGQVAGGERVLDVGCGSGVLAVAALALGAAAALAVDVDPAALAATRANADRNGVAAALATAATVDAAPAGRHDLVVANMLLPQLVALAPQVAAAVAPGGTVVLSGLLVDQLPGALAAYGAAGLAPVAGEEGGHVEDGWVALSLRPA